MKTQSLLLAALLLVPAGTLLLANQEPQDTPPAPASEIPADTEVKTTASGLQYSVLQAGNQKEFPKLGDKVKVHYTGWLTDGTKFDSSVDRGEPSEFALGAVIEGWNEALQLMSPGAKYKLTIPSDLAYGDQGSPPKIPGGATLVFEVELLAVTERALPFIAWDETRPTTEMDNGTKYQVLQPGQEGTAADGAFVYVEFARFGADEKITIASTMTGLLVGPPENPNLPFYGPLLKEMKVGSHFLASVPQALDLNNPQETEKAEATLWQVIVRASLKCETPEFYLPKPEELTTTESGLQYMVVREGFGKMPQSYSQVAVHYSGWLTDGTPFDASYGKPQPATFPLGRVIAGWTEGLQLMKEGGKYIFVIPGDLAYGERGSPPKIGPNATLVFTVELLQSRP